MSLKSIECVVRELQSTVVCLVNKVESLECKISEQSAIIIKLSSSSEKNSTHKLLPSAPVQTPPSTSATGSMTQRPMRNARIQASAAITEMTNTTSKRRNVRDNTTVLAKTATEPSSQLEFSSGNEIITCEKASPMKTPILNAVTVSCASTAVDKSSENLTNKEWQVVSRQRRHKQRPAVIVGTAKDIGDLQAADRLKHIQAWCFKPDTTTETILGFLNKIVKADYTVEKRNIKSERHASFIIGMPENVYDEVTIPTAWPSGIRFSEWFLFRPRNTRGSERGD